MSRDLRIDGRLRNRAKRDSFYLRLVLRWHRACIQRVALASECALEPRVGKLTQARRSTMRRFYWWTTTKVLKIRACPSNAHLACSVAVVQTVSEG